jgi:hypothetical protein
MEKVEITKKIFFNRLKTRSHLAVPYYNPDQEDAYNPPVNSWYKAAYEFLFGQLDPHDQIYDDPANPRQFVDRGS